MKPIQANRCGYTGYKCSSDPVHSLDPLFILGVPVCVEDPNNTGQIVYTDPESKLIYDLMSAYTEECPARTRSAFSTIASALTTFFNMTSAPITGTDMYIEHGFWRVAFRSTFGGGLVPVYDKYFRSIYGDLWTMDVSSVVTRIYGDAQYDQSVSQKLDQLYGDLGAHFDANIPGNYGLQWLYIAFGRTFAGGLWPAVQTYIRPIGGQFEQLEKRYLTPIRYTTLDNWYNIPLSFPASSPDIQILLDMSISKSMQRLIPDVRCTTKGQGKRTYPLGSLFDYYNNNPDSAIRDSDNHFGNPDGVFVPMMDRLMCDNCAGLVDEIYGDRRKVGELKPYPEAVDPAYPISQGPVSPIMNIQPPTLPTDVLFKDIDIIEDFLNIYDPGDLACPIENLLIAMTSESMCSTVKIILAEGVPLVRGSDDGPPELGVCKYKVVNGVDDTATEVTLYINSEEITIPLTIDGSYDPVEAPFNLYLNVPRRNKVASYLSTVPDATTDEGTTSIYIGGVKEVYGTNREGSSLPASCEKQDENGISPEYYAMYVIEQDECPVSVVVPETELCGIEDLLVAMNMESSCATIRIKLARGNPMVRGACTNDLALDECYYNVVNGENNGGGYVTVTIDGKEYDVSLNLGDILAPFSLFLVIPGTRSIQPFLTLDSSSAGDGDTLVHIGGVREVDGSPDSIGDADMCEGSDDASRECYRMYVIYENECPIAEYTVPPICGIESLIAEMANHTICDSMEIEHTQGVSIVSWAEGEPEPGFPYNEYMVHAGTITINNQPIVVDNSIVVNEFPATIYLKIHRRGSSIIAEYTRDLDDPDVVMELGAIRIVRSSKDNVPEGSGCTNETSSMNYKMLAASVVNCPDYINYNTAAIEDLLASLIDGNICTDIKIERMDADGTTSTEPAIFYYESQDQPPSIPMTYKIHPFTAYYNEKAYSVAETEFRVIDSDVYWYIEVSKETRGTGEDNPNVQPKYWEVQTTLNMTPAPEVPENCIFIGGVRVVTTDNYRAYIIDQDNCSMVTDLARFPDMTGSIQYIEGEGINMLPASPVEGVVSAMLQDSGCEVFGITKTKGKSTATKKSMLGKCTYSIRHGSINVNGAPVSVTGISQFTVTNSHTKGNPRAIWLNVSVNATSVKAELATSKHGSYSQCIATVYAVSSKDMVDPPDWLRKSEEYSMYVVNQVDCRTDFDMIRLDEGFMFTQGNGSMQHPYKVYEYCEL